MKSFTIALLALTSIITRPVETPTPSRPAAVRPSATTPDWDHLPGLVTPARRAVISSPIEGVLRRRLVEEGDGVRADQVLGVLDDRLANLSLDAARIAAERRAGLELAKLELKVAKRAMARFEKANQVGASSDHAHDEARARHSKAMISVELAREELAVAQSQVRIAEARLDQHEIRAPFAGRIVRVHAEAGATLQPGREYVELVALDRLHAELHLPAAAFASLRVGQRHQLQAHAPVDRKIEARLIFIDPLMDAATETFRCRFEIQNPDLALPAGFKVRLLPTP